MGRTSFALVLLFCGQAFAQVAPSPSVMRSVEFADRTFDASGRLSIVRFRDRAPRLPATEASARQVLTALGVTESLVSDRQLRAHGFTVIRFVRTAWGLPVTGSSALVRFDSQGQVDFVSLDLGSDIRADMGSDPGVDAAGDAIDAPLAAAVRAVRWVRARPIHHELVAFDDGLQLRRAWAVEVEGAVHERAKVYLDAATGEVMAIQSLILHQLGRVYDPNPPLAVDPTDEELTNLTSARFLTGRYARAQSCRPAGVSECVPEQRAQADMGGDFLYDPVDPAFDDEFAEVNVYFHANRVAEYFRDVHSFEWTCCGDSNIMDVLANYVETPGVAFQNAFYSPSSCGGSRCALMAFGQSSTKDFGYDGDVVYHEYGHGIVDVTAGLGTFDVDPLFGVGYENGALNEGTADYFSATITGDPNLADYFAGSGPAAGEGGLRELGNALRCPDDLFGESHADGRIWGGALWEIRTAIGAEKADPLAFATLMALTDGADIDTAGMTLSATAAAMDGLSSEERAMVDSIIADRGLIGCGRIVPMTPEVVYQGYSGNEQLSGSLGGGVVPLHYSIDIPSDASALRISIESITAAGQYEVFVANGRAVRYRGAGRPPLVADDSFTTPLIRLTRTTDHPLPVCDTLYLAIIATDLTTRGQSVYEISAEFETESGLDCPPPEVDAGPPPVDTGVPDASAPDAGLDAGEMDAGEGSDVGGGCGCTIAGGPDNRAGLAMALGLCMLIAWRRRK